MVMAELTSGLFLGWMARLAVTALPLAGQIIAVVGGHASVLQPDSVLGPQGAAVGRLLSLAAPVLMLCQRPVRAAIAAPSPQLSRDPGRGVAAGGDTAQTVVTAVAACFALALRLSAPFVLASIVWHITLALLGRLVPNLQVFFLAAPAQLLGGLVLLASLAAALLAAWQEQTAASLRLLPGL